MKVTRFRIAGLMVAVAIAALDFGAIRALFGPHADSLSYQRSIFLLLGALPMANVLAIGMLTGQRHPESRPFLLGFEAFGAMALAIFIALAICFPREVVMAYLAPVVDLTNKFIGRGHPFISISIQGFCAVVMLGWPQLTFALVGGFLSRRFKITITSR